MIEFKNVTKKYNLVKALDSVSFQIMPGEIVGLVGANGAGKTTAIKLITKYITPEQGTIFIDNQDIVEEKQTCQNISYIPDEPVYYEFMTVAEHLQFIQAMYPNGEYSIEEIIDMLSLSRQLTKVPNALSKGNKQKLMLATAFLRSFDYLIADEPFTGLDPKQIKSLKHILMELRKRNKGILLSTHLLDVIELFCDRYIMIDDGHIIAIGTKEEILTKHNLCPKLSVEETYITLTDYSGKGLHYDEQDYIFDDEE